MLVVILLVVLVGIVVIIYNGLVTERNNVKNAWSQIEVQLQRRFDLIPNLIETVKGYMQHEEGVLTKVAELRTLWANANGVQEKANLDNELSQTLKSIMAVSENYPELKANQNFVSLQEELSNTENKISVSRNSYNEVVTGYNTKLETIPSNIIASLFGFKSENLFKVESEEIRKNIKVDFSK